MLLPHSGSTVLTCGFQSRLARKERVQGCRRASQCLHVEAARGIPIHDPWARSGWELLSLMGPRGNGKQDIGEPPDDLGEYTSTHFEINYELPGESVKNLENVTENMK